MSIDLLKRSFALLLRFPWLAFCRHNLRCLTLLLHMLRTSLAGSLLCFLAFVFVFNSTHLVVKCISFASIILFLGMVLPALA